MWPADLPRALGSLCAAVAVAAPLAAAVAQSDPVAAVERLGLRMDRGMPMTISADELEAFREADGRERVVFQHAVRVEQGGLQIDCNWLEAIYPAPSEAAAAATKATAGLLGAQPGGPRRITARGDVLIRQQNVRVTCSEAVLDRRADRATCTSEKGPAFLRRGEDVVQGKTIVFNLRDGRVTVKGGARVFVQPTPVPAPVSEPAPETPAPQLGGADHGSAQKRQP